MQGYLFSILLSCLEAADCDLQAYEGTQRGYLADSPLCYTRIFHPNQCISSIWLTYSIVASASMISACVLYFFSSGLTMVSAMV